MRLDAGLRRGDEARAVVALVVDRLEHLHDRDVGAAVERPGEGADPGGERREEVRRARADHAHGRGRAVLLVVGVEEQEQVQRAGDLGLRDVVLVRLREHHVQEVLAERQLLLREDVGQALLVAVDHRPDRPDLRDRHRRREVEVRQVLLEIVRRQVRIMRRERGHDRGQHRHRRRVLREPLEDLLHLRLDRGVLPQEQAEFLALRLRSAARRR